jgi:hypothetical protein
MWRYFGLTKRGGPAEAGGVEEKVDLLLAEITKLRLAPPVAPPSRLAPTARNLTELVRQNWEQILVDVKNRSRVAWMLLKSATVESVSQNGITLFFSREGERDGFLSAGHDSALVEVLDEALGIRPEVFAIVRARRDDSSPDEPPF